VAEASDTYIGFVTHQSANTVSVFDPSSNAVITTFSTDTSPRCVHLSPGGKYVYVASVSSFTVNVYRTSDYTKVATITTPTAPYSICSNANGDKIYIADTGTKIYVVDAATNTISKTITSTASGYGQMYRYEDKIYAAKKAANKVVVIDTTTDTISTYINVGSQPTDVTGNTILGKVYVANNGATTLSVINPETDTVTSTVDLGKNNPAEMTIKSDGSRLYIPCVYSNCVVIVDTSTDTVVTTIDVGSLPRGSAIEPNNGYVFVANFNNTNLSVISTATNTLTASINLSYGTPDYMIISKIAPGPTPTEMEVTFNINKGGIVNMPDVNVSVYDAITGEFRDSDNTDDAGNTIFILTTGKRYTLQISGVDVSLSQTIQVQPNDQFYYIDVCTGQILGATQYASLYKLHAVRISITDLFIRPISDCTVTIYKNSVEISSWTTDSYGRITLYAQSDVQYLIWVNKSSIGANRTLLMELGGDTHQIDMTGYISGAPSGFIPGGNQTSNQSGHGTNNADQDITIIVTPAKSSSSGNITVNYTDMSGSTTTINISIYTKNASAVQLFGEYNIGIQPDNLQILSHTEIINSNNGSYVHDIDHDPAGEDYLVIVTGTYTTANGGTSSLYREYTVSFKGPSRFIPGLPSDWYKYLCFMSFIGVGLVVRKPWVEEGLVVLAVMASVFYCIGWMYEYGDAYCIIAITLLWVIGVGSVSLKREREGRM
jgi:YVTN family beta-propeller protein